MFWGYKAFTCVTSSIHFDISTCLIFNFRVRNVVSYVFLNWLIWCKFLLGRIVLSTCGGFWPDPRPRRFFLLQFWEVSTQNSPKGIQFIVIWTLKSRSTKTRKWKSSKIDSFNSKPSPTTEPQEVWLTSFQKMKSSLLEYLSAWALASSLLSPERDKISNFSTKF